MTLSARWEAPGWWNRFWFQEGSAKNLAAARIIFGLQALWIMLSRDFAGIAAMPEDFWAATPTAVRWRYLLFPGQAGLEAVLQWVAIVALVAVVLGILPRLSCLTAGLLLYHLAPLETVFWYASGVFRGLEIAVLGLVTLAFAPCADAWSVDSLRRAPPERPGWEYHWPLVLLQLYLAQMYLFAGYAKVYRVGWDWGSAENMRAWLLLLNQEPQLVAYDTIGPWIADRPALCVLMGLAGWAMDFGFILAVFWKRSRWVLLPLAFLFHLGIVYVLNIVSLNVPQLLVFVDWDAVSRRLSRRRALRPAPA